MFAFNLVFMGNNMRLAGLRYVLSTRRIQMLQNIGRMENNQFTRNAVTSNNNG